jgi:hypothetical protein
VFALAGFFIGQVRTLQKYGWLANAAIWINVFVIIETMAIVPHEGPLYAAVQASAGTALGGDLVTAANNGTGAFPPVVHFAGLPPDSRGFTGALNGLMQAVYAYGGAMLFIEFMSEMKKPRDFWKGMICAQSFIYFVYIFYGCFLYAYQGQYAINPSFEGVSIYAWQTVGNIMAFLSALIAAGLYGNIGVKVLYNNIFTRGSTFDNTHGQAYLGCDYSSLLVVSIHRLCCYTQLLWSVGTCRVPMHPAVHLHLSSNVVSRICY